MRQRETFSSWASLSFSFLRKRLKTNENINHMLTYMINSDACFASILSDASKRIECKPHWATYKWHNWNAIRQQLRLLGNRTEHTSVMRRDISSRVTAKFWFSTGTTPHIRRRMLSACMWNRVDCASFSFSIFSHFVAERIHAKY